MPPTDDDMTTLTLEPTTSELCNVMVQIIMARGVPFEVVAEASELIAVEARFNEWFLFVGKRVASDADVERLLDMLNEVTDGSVRAHAEWRAGGDTELLAMRVSALLRRFREAWPGAVGT